MPSKKSRRKPLPRPSAASIGSRLIELAEEMDIMVPELTARIAALEHLLMEKGLCTRDDLIRARRFVDDQEGR